MREERERGVRWKRGNRLRERRARRARLGNKRVVPGRTGK